MTLWWWTSRGRRRFGARFYDLDTQQPFYVGRDGIKRTQLKDIEYERRVGYSYLGNYAEGLLEKEYPRWKQGL